MRKAEIEAMRRSKMMKRKVKTKIVKPTNIEKSKKLK